MAALTLAGKTVDTSRSNLTPPGRPLRVEVDVLGSSGLVVSVIFQNIGCKGDDSSRNQVQRLLPYGMSLKCIRLCIAFDDIVKPIYDKAGDLYRKSRF